MMTFNATKDGKVDHRLLAVVVAATLNPERGAKCMSRPPAHPHRGGRPDTGDAWRAQCWSSWGSTTSGSISSFDAHPRRSAMEVEERYYFMAPNSCVLPLFVGHVCSLRSSLDAVESGEAFAESLGGQLEELGCRLDHCLQRGVRGGRWTRGRGGRGAAWSAA